MLFRIEADGGWELIDLDCGAIKPLGEVDRDFGLDDRYTDGENK